MTSLCSEVSGVPALRHEGITKIRPTSTSLPETTENWLKPLCQPMHGPNHLSVERQHPTHRPLEAPQCTATHRDTFSRPSPHRVYHQSNTAGSLVEPRKVVSEGAHCSNVTPHPHTPFPLGMAPRRHSLTTENRVLSWSVLGLRQHFVAAIEAVLFPFFTPFCAHSFGCNLVPTASYRSSYGAHWQGNSDCLGPMPTDLLGLCYGCRIDEPLRTCPRAHERSALWFL